MKRRMKQQKTPALVSTTRLRTTMRWMVTGFALFLYAWLDYRRYVPPFVFITQGTVLLLLGGWGIWKAVRRQGVVVSPLAWPLVAFLGASALSTLFSVDMRRSFDGLLVTLVLVLSFFMLCDMVRAGWRLSALVNILIWTATLALGLGVWTTASHFWEQWQAASAGYPAFLVEFRLYRVADHPNLLAALINLAMPFVIMRLAGSENLAARVGWSAWLAGYVVVLVFTRSRGGMVAAGGMVVLSAGWLLVWHGIPWRENLAAWFRRTLPIWGGIVAYGALFVLLLSAPDMLASSFQSGEAATDGATRSAYTTSGGRTVESAATGRMAFWGVAWHSFQRHPLLGSGPVTYGYAFVEESPGVRQWLTAHAHNLYLNILGTQGLVGAALFAWVVLAGLVTFVLALWRSRAAWVGGYQGGLGEEPGEANTWPLVLAVCVALSGFLVHSLVDVPGSLHSNHLLVILVTVVGLEAAGALQSERATLPRGVVLVALVPLVLAGVLVRYGVAQKAMFEGVVHGVTHNWEAAAHAMDRAVESDPQFVFYQEQRGYAYSVLAMPVAGTGDAGAQQRMLASYALVLRERPPLVPVLLNAGEAFRTAGMPALADDVLERAIALPQAQQWALPWLLLAERRAEQGRIPEAESLFERAFAAEPHAPAMAACQRSSACRTAANQRKHTPSIEIQAHEQAQALLAQGQPAQALAELDQVPISSASPLPWIDRAMVFIALGQLEQAEFALDTARTLQGAGIHASVAAFDARARAALALARGEQAQAIDALEAAAYPGVRLSYSYVLFHRVALPGELSPQVDLLQRTADDLAVYRQLATLHEQQGQTDAAARARAYADALAALLEP